MRLKPAKGSPKSCTCSNVDLSGRYSPGALVKCEQCITVYRSTQKNSCPNGMKLFAPRSRSDWKTVLDSAGPLRAPHWIIDITRPQNGCGGCTRYSMKSTTPQQATWRTTDRAPWWLRDTRNGEPNGDYKGNCFLNLHGHPKSPNNLKFNDHNCHYRSRSYYCQPKMVLMAEGFGDGSGEARPPRGLRTGGGCRPPRGLGMDGGTGKTPTSGLVAGEKGACGGNKGGLPAVIPYDISFSYMSHFDKI